MSEPTCELCDMPAVKSAIIGDHYYKSLCLADYDRLVKGQSVSSGQARYNRERDFEDHEADIRQPYNGDLPDKEFIRLYPETARKMFSDEQMRQAERA